MARNQEKAQSMLYRFREAQAAELGLGTRSDRRPLTASACKSLRECERWRGELLREISRKVAKIEDAGLSDYETRDLNDEINKLMREKRHWENQIVVLGGANYRRNVAMLDDDGKEVPGTKGYKYFGRAKELPGVKELFQSRKKSEDEDNAALVFYKKFLGQGPAYHGNLNDMDGALLRFERHAEDKDWENVCSNLREALGLPAENILFSIPRQPPSDSLISDAAQAGTKRKITDSDADTPSSVGVKRVKADSPSEADQALVHARAVVSHIHFLSVENLLAPKLPTHSEMEAALLALRKKALVEEYFGDAE
ncbi:Isy1-like splicing factor [Mycena metata]|uniref:Isy1-like splicing factor n=1 Tax=Mycena metata TaxID=1033252 RepID=A0AAD7NLI3_9AGAR|nr:Isy1-like splicing factor [Mycena metata]